MNCNFCGGIIKKEYDEILLETFYKCSTCGK